jgi:hypothetical protein
VAQFRVEFVLDQASGRYLAELYNPENPQELIVRTEALYPTQASAVLGLVEIFKDAMLKFPGKKTARKKRRAGRAGPSARRKPRRRARR